MIGINNALEAAALTRIRLANTGSVLAKVAPQFAAQAARLAMEAVNNAKGSLDVLMVTCGQRLLTEELSAMAAADRPLGGAAIGSMYTAANLPNETGEEVRSWGSLGDIEFEIENSPSAFSAKDAVSYAQHAIIGGKPVLQFTGQKLQALTITVSWHSYVTEGIEARLAGLLEAMDKKLILPYVTGSPLLGSVYVGDYVITGIDHTVKKYNPDGTLMSLEATVQLLEWRESADLEVSEKEPKAVTKSGGKTPSQGARAQADVTKDKQGNVLDPGTGAAFGMPKSPGGK